MLVIERTCLILRASAWEMMSVGVGTACTRFIALQSGTTGGDRKEWGVFWGTANMTHQIHVFSHMYRHGHGSVSTVTLPFDQV